METNYIYYKNTLNGKIYRTAKCKYNTGEQYLSVERWSGDFENWGGHIHDHEKTRKEIAELINIVEITEQEKNDELGLK